MEWPTPKDVTVDCRMAAFWALNIFILHNVYLLNSKEKNAYKFIMKSQTTRETCMWIRWNTENSLENDGSACR